MADQILRAIHRDHAIRVVAAVTTGLCQTAAARHLTSPLISCALGRGLSAGLLLCTLTKGDERVTLQIQCDGPLRGLAIDAYDDGDVRGHPAVARLPLSPALALVHLPPPPEGPEGQRQLLAPLVGQGLLNVTRDMGINDRYQGQTRLVHGEIDEDVEHYLRTSEQIPSALGCDVLQDPDGLITAAGGVLFQVLPGGDEATISAAQSALRSGALYQALRDPAPLTPQALCAAVLPGLSLEPLDTRPVRFQCRCSRERIQAMLQILSPRDLDEMILEGSAEITCNYCNQTYLVDAETLARVRHSLAPRQPQ